MAHIVLIASGLTGLLNASLALMHQLKRAGHRITYASPTDQRELIASQGIAYVPLNRWGILPDDPSLGRWQKLHTLRQRQQRAIDALGVQDFDRTLEELAPDLLLIDIEMHPHIMAAVLSQQRVALLCPFISIWKRPNLPPIHTGIVPGKGWRGQWWGIEWSWLRYGWCKWREFQRDRWQRVGLDWISILRCYARQIGYPFRARFGFSQWIVPYPHGALPILCLHGFEMDFPHSPHPSMHYLGPMVWEDRQEPVEPAIYALLEKLFEKRRSGEKPLIYCGVSSLRNANRQFLQQLVKAASLSPEWDFVVGLGGKLNPDRLGPLPPNLCALRWAPQLQILKHADCAVINSGSHSITECVHFGVPMLVYSLNRDDQNGDAARVVYHGLGIAGDLRQDKATQICQYLQALLTDSSYRERIISMGDRIRHYALENRAVQVVEELLDSQNYIGKKGDLRRRPIAVEATLSRADGGDR